MAGETTSPNMSLPVPGVSNTSGPQWATDLNNCLNIIDAHSHSPGSGVQITPDGINVNENFPLNNFGLKTAKYLEMVSQTVALTGTNFASILNGNLYFNDGSGNSIQMTSGGGVAGTPGSIGSLTSPAAATYSAGSTEFIWTASSGKAAAMDNGAVTIRETNVSSAKGITLASPSSLAADYQLTLPAAVPGSNSYIASNTSGVLSFATADNIGSAMTSTGANAIQVSSTRTTGTTVGVGGVAISSSSGTFTSSSSIYTDITNLSVTITTSGRPVCVGLISDGSGNPTIVGVTGTTDQLIADFRILRGVTEIATFAYELEPNGTPGSSTGKFIIAPPPPAQIDAVAAGTYTYKAQVKTGVIANTAEAQWLKLVAYEL